MLLMIAIILHLGSLTDPHYATEQWSKHGFVNNDMTFDVINLVLVGQIPGDNFFISLSVKIIAKVFQCNNF